MAKSVALSNGCSWRTQTAAKEHFREMLHRYRDDETIEDRSDHEDLVALLERYDEAIVDGPPKTGDGIDYFLRKRNNHEGYSTPSFWVARVDGTSTDFSYLHAVRGQPKGRGQEFYDACRDAVQADLVRAKTEFFREHGNEHGWVQCELTGNWVTSDDAHLDHAWPSFGQLVAMFRAARGWSAGIPDGVLAPAQDAQTKTCFIDANVADAFRQLHHGSAILRIVSATANLSQAAKQRRPTIARPVRI